MSMYNNDVTYDKKWDTAENKRALDIVQKKYFSRSTCGPSCPTSWAPEVLELFQYLDKEFGIQWNVSSLGGYRAESTWYYCWTINPFTATFKSFLRYFFKRGIDPKNQWENEYVGKMSFFKKLKSTFGSFTHSFRYGKSLFNMQVVNPILNRIYKPKICLGQFKEKYGSLTVYFSGPDYLEEHIDYMIAKTEIKLALKGAYYPVESLYNNNSSWYVGGDNRPDDVEIRDKTDYNGKPCKEHKFFSYRKPMRDLGLNLEDIAKAAEVRKAAIAANIQDP
jgi:hypothetical protein